MGSSYNSEVVSNLGSGFVGNGGSYGELVVMVGGGVNFFWMVVMECNKVDEFVIEFESEIFGDF